MKSISVKRLIKAPIDRVFDLLSNHEAYASFPGIDVARLERPGSSEKNGLGALRYVKAGPAWFREEITTFERPTRMDYLIVESLVPMRHEGGILIFREAEGGTEVTWTSRFSVPVPLVGFLLERVLAGKLEQGFAATLKHVDRALAKN
jgi:uncharacterized protein YndB with AHSA1/START domain